MRIPYAFATSLLLAGFCLTAAASPSAPARSLHKTLTTPAPRAAGCLDNSRLMSHVAYLPTASGSQMRCGHLLSTDTMLTVHRWDRT